MRLLTHLLFERLQLLVLNCRLCSDGETWKELEKYSSQWEVLPHEILGLLDSVLSLLGVVRPRPPTPMVVELDEDESLQLQCHSHEI